MTRVATRWLLLAAPAALGLFSAAASNILGGRSSALPPAPLAPEPKEMLVALFALSQVPLSVSPTCAGVGTERDDATIGQYLSGFLAELSNPEASNAITTSAVEEQSESGIMIWICSVMIRHARGEDIWSWGIEFSVRASDRAVLADSVRCLGAG
ncbi:MAG: hypothetical protein R3F44_17435 [Candidatus Competibacteraceae bacterium]